VPAPVEEPPPVAIVKEPKPATTTRKPPHPDWSEWLDTVVESVLTMQMIPEKEEPQEPEPATVAGATKKPPDSDWTEW